MHNAFYMLCTSIKQDEVKIYLKGSEIVIKDILFQIIDFRQTSDAPFRILSMKGKVYTKIKI